MTDQAGSSNKPVEASGPPPWERKWNDAKEFVGKAVDSVVDTAKKAVESVQMPWERNWGGSGSVPSPAAPTPVPGPYKPIMETEAKMKVAAQIDPNEKRDLSAAMRVHLDGIRELKVEISRTKDMKTKKILTDELKKLMEMT